MSLLVSNLWFKITINFLVGELFINGDKNGNNDPPETNPNIAAQFWTCICNPSVIESGKEQEEKENKRHWGGKK